MRSLLISALSFEERCVGAFRDLVQQNALQEAIFLNYGAEATPEEEASHLRNDNWDRVRRLADLNGVVVSAEHFDPYATGPLQRRLSARAQDFDHTFIDVSCVTRPHVLACCQAAATLAPSTWTVGYTFPFSYGELNRAASSGGWRDTLALPIGQDSSLRNEGLALGLLLLGHQSDRAAIALTQLEPAAGVVVISVRRDRPDLHRTALGANRSLLTHLEQLRMPGPRSADVAREFGSDGWEVVALDVNNLVEEAVSITSRLVRAARALEAPIVLFPFGPKNLIFVVGLLLAREYPEASWAVYPVPRTHPLNYSDGIMRTEWLSGDSLEAASQALHLASSRD